MNNFMDHVTGRHHVMLVDLKPVHDWEVVNTEIVAQKALANPLYAGLTAGTVNSATDDAARAAARTAYLELRLMQANGYAAISGHRKTLRGSWYNQKA